MEFLNPKTRRSFAIRLWVGYVLCAIAIGFATLILVFMANGYAFDKTSHGVIQNGLVALDSEPGDAEVVLDGNLEKNKTATKLTIPGGTHSVVLKKTGYNSWMHSFELEGGSVETLNYAKLLPQTPKAVEVAKYTEKPVLVSESTNQKRLLVLPSAKSPVFDLYDMSSLAAPQKILVPLAAMGVEAGPLGTVEVVSWSADANYALLKHVHGGKTDYVMCNITQPDASFAVSSVLKVTADNFRFDQKVSERLYALSVADGSLRTVNVREKSVSEVLVSGVLAFDKQDDSALIYVTQTGAPTGKANVRLHQGAEDYLLATLPVSSVGYQAQVERFGGSWWYAVVHPTEEITQLYREPFDALKSGGSASITTTLRLGSSSQIRFSPDGRFVMAQRGTEFALYNFDNGRYFRYRLDSLGAETPQLSWISNYQLGAVTIGGYAVYDFDGENLQYINAGQVTAAGFIGPKFRTAALLRESGGQYLLDSYNLE